MKPYGYDPDWDSRIDRPLVPVLGNPSDWSSSLVRFLYASYFGSPTYWKDIQILELSFGQPLGYENPSLDWGVSFTLENTLSGVPFKYILSLVSSTLPANASTNGFILLCCYYNTDCWCCKPVNK